MPKKTINPKIKKGTSPKKTATINKPTIITKINDLFISPCPFSA